jgi:hypothetical protein
MMIADGDAEDHMGGHLPKIDLGFEQDDDTVALRIFNGIDSFQGTREDNWGVKTEWPSWLNDVHNTKSGRTFIFGSGPSLLSQLDLLPRMQQEETWTVNRIARWKDLPFTPVHHVTAEPGPIGAWGKMVYPIYDYPTAINRIAINWCPVTAPGWLWCPKAPDDIQMRWEGFEGLKDELGPLITGWASPLTLCQLAAWMGYTEFYFLGIDLTQTGQAWDKESGRTLYPRNERSILECFERARRDIERAGRAIIDCTPGGKVNAEGVLEYQELEEVLSATA